MESNKSRENPVEWWYLSNATTCGPISYGQLLALFSAGTIDEQTSVRRAGAGQWRPFIEIANNRVAACQQFAFVCSKQWADLLPTSADSIRHCSDCNKDVYRCESPSELKQHALLGHCAALCVPDEEDMLLGIPASDEDDETLEDGLQQTRSARPKALVLLGTILRVCGFIYAFAFVVSGVVSVGCIVVVIRTQGPTMAHDFIGAWLGSMLFTGIGALACFAVAELINLAIRGVQALEETVTLLRSMQHKSFE